MNKIISLTLVLAMMLTILVGCGGKTEETQAPETTAPVVETTEPVVEETEAPETEPAVEETQAAADSEMKALIQTIYANHGPMELMMETMPNEYFPIESIMESITYYTGLADGSKIAEIAISEPMMGQAYSLVLVKVTSADDAASVAQEMYDNIDQRKWICVEADTKTAAYAGDVVMFFMVNSDFAEQATPESMVEAFKASVDGEVTVIG
jgi:hypothetical protein